MWKESKEEEKRRHGKKASMLRTTQLQSIAFDFISVHLVIH